MSSPSLFSAMGPCKDRVWLSRWLEVTSDNLRELHVMRQEAEERVRGVLDDQHNSQEIIWTKWQRNGTAEDRGKVTKQRRSQELDRAKNPELEHIEEEVPGIRQRRNTLSKRRKRTSIPQALDPCLQPDKAQVTYDAQNQIPVNSHHCKVISNHISIDSKHCKLASNQISKDYQHCKTPNQISSDSKHCKVTPNQISALTQELHQKIILGERPSVQATGSKGSLERVGTGYRVRAESWQSLESTGHSAQDKAMEQGQDSLPVSEGREFFQQTEQPFLRRIGSGSLAPRLRLGSSGVTSDLLFTKRFSGNCLSTHSSGFYDNSDLDSISSSSSSLYSDTSCHTSFSMMSPQRSSGMRPRSIDYTNERRKELQNGRAQPRRPISAGALEGLSNSSMSSSRYDINQYNDRTSGDYTYSLTPPLCVIQQRHRAERYICKLALKYRCRPGVSNPFPDLGPPTPKTPSYFYSECRTSCPPSPQINSLSTSLGDVRKTPKGSWGRFFSRVMLKKDSRIAASELNLQHCIISPQNSLRSPSLADGQLVRAKSFRDLLSVKPFKKSQRALNKVW